MSNLISVNKCLLARNDISDPGHATSDPDLESYQHDVVLAGCQFIPELIIIGTRGGEKIKEKNCRY